MPVVFNTGSLSLPSNVSISTPDNDAWESHAQIVCQYLSRVTDGKHHFELTSGTSSHVLFKLNEGLSSSGYKLSVTENKIVLEAATLKGLSHGTATLVQVFGANADSELPCLEIVDKPTSGYRSFMIDMGRNPHSFELLQETIDLAWFYKVDSLHLHLTDDQRIAFPSSTFPEIWDGLISKTQFEQLEEYASQRGVTLIPELEVPGHSSILRNRYPEAFGTSGTELATTDKAFGSIKILLDEMMAIFKSSPYIHIGGDEAFGIPEEAQRALINRLHAYLKSKGRKTIVWEGPRPGQGDNRVNSEVIHVNWRTINYPADQMLKDGYKVVNATWDPLYLVDHYPRTNFTMTSPQYIYETLKLTRFKHVNPGIPTFSKPIETESTDQLIGFCMPWWEGREENFFPQVVPRFIPFADIAWNADQQRDYEAAKKRFQTAEQIRRRIFYPVTISISNLVVPADGVFHRSASVRLVEDSMAKSELAEIRYTLDGSRPKPTSLRYTEPFEVTETVTIRAACFKDNRQIGLGSRQNLIAVVPNATDKNNLAFGKPVTSSATSAAPFSVERLTDGGLSNLEFYLGYPAEPKPIEITVDLLDTFQVSKVVVHSYSISNSYESYSVEVSADGENFSQVAERLERPSDNPSPTEHLFSPRKIRYVRIVSHGNKGYVFDSFSKLIEIQAFQQENLE